MNTHPPYQGHSPRQSYDHLQTSNHLLYPGLLSWQHPHNVSCSAAASASQFHLPSSLSSQQSVPASGVEAPNTLDYVNSESTWPANYLRPGWNNTLADDSHASKSVSNYRHVAYGTPVRPSSATRRGPMSQRRATLLQSQENLYTPSINSYEDAISSGINHISPGAAFSAPVPPHFYPEHPTASSQPSHSDCLPLQPPLMPALPLDWPAISSSELTRQNNAMFASPPSMGMVAGAITHNNTNLTNPLWNMNAPASEATTPSLDTMLDPSSGWMYLDASTGATVPLHPPFALPEPGTQVHTHALPALAEKQIEKRRSVSKQKLPKIASSFTERAQKVKLSRRQGRMSEEARAKAAQMRKNGPCIRCKLYKLGCDGNTPCQRCVKVIDSARSFLEPCSRANIETISLVRHVNGRFNQTEVSFLPYHWNEHENGPHVMDIMWNLPGYGPMLDNPAIPVVFRAYHPENLQVIDSTRNYWQTSNAVVTVDQPPYAVYDTAALMTNVERYLLRNQPMIEQWIFNHNQNNELALLTYNEAMRQRDQFGSHLLDLAIQMQCGAVVSQGYGIVWSSHIPGIKEYDYRTFGPSGYEAYDRNGRDRPLPTAIGHQMDVAILKHINRIQKQLLKELKKKIFNPGIKPWYELFLTFFVLLCNLEYIHGSAERYMNVKRNTMLEGQVSYIVKSQLEEWEFSASVLLQHFRCVLRGFLPLKLARDNLEELRVQAKLDPLAVQFVSNLVSLLGEGDPWGQPLSLVDLSGDSTAHKWIPQLFKESYG